MYGKLTLEKFEYENACKLDVCLLAVDGDFSKEWAQKLAAAGVLVIDNSSAFRYTDGVPLCIPEINIGATKGKKLVSNPNCTTGRSDTSHYTRKEAPTEKTHSTIQPSL